MMYVFVLVFMSPSKVCMHLQDFDETWYELSASGEHLSATLLTGNNKRVETRNCEAVTTMATHTLVGEMMYRIVRDLGKVFSVFYDVRVFFHAIEITI
jgi:hypothetical protein